MTTTGAAGSYTAKVRSVTTVAGHTCSSAYSPELQGSIRARGRLGQAADPLCGCYAGMCPDNGVCAASASQCNDCVSLCTDYMGQTPFHVYLFKVDLCYCVFNEAYPGLSGWYKADILDGNCTYWRVYATDQGVYPPTADQSFTICK
jgi:hypothetical protein